MSRYGRTTLQRLAERYVRTPGGCWYWTGATDRHGYGRIQYADQWQPAYRVMMIALGYDVTGLDVDHLCRNRRCVNPGRLDVVTKAENSRRRWVNNPTMAKVELRTSCRNGHGYTDENTHVNPTTGRRICRACNRAASARYAARKKAAA